MRVVIYSRVSTDDKEQDPERQILKCRQYCEMHEHELIGSFAEFCSGDSDFYKRREGVALLSLNPEGIVIFSMDRLSRQHPVKVMNLIQSLKERGIKILSITEPAFNMESEFSEIMLFLIGWFNNYFLIKLRRDTRAGLDRARAAGKVLGRRRVEFNRFRAKQLICEGKTFKEVASELHVSASTLCRFKKGGFVFNGKDI